MLQNIQPITFKKPEQKSNKLLNMKLPSVTVHEKQCVLKCHQDDDQPTIARAYEPLNVSTPVSYFAAEIIRKSSRGKPMLCVGLISKDNYMRKFAGMTKPSIGLISNQIFYNKKQIFTTQHTLKEGDVIGCGINCHNKTIFFTLNDKLLIENIRINQDSSSKWTQFYPAVGVQKSHDEIKCHFNAGKGWKFNYQSYVEFIQNKIIRQVNQEKSCNIYPLIHEYLRFNGYGETLNMMENKMDQLCYQPINRWCSNPVQVPSIMLKQENEGKLNKFDKFDKIEQQIQQQPSRFKQRFRQRIMSESFDNNNIEQIPRKNTQLQIEIVPEDTIRKLSNISNISIMDESVDMQILVNESKKQQKKKKKQNNEENKKIQFNIIEQFFINQRLEIISYLKQGQIELACKIIRQKIPSLFEVECFLYTFMKAHIFLRKIKRQGALSAIKYAKDDKDFQKYKDNLFPVFSLQKQKVQWRALRNIFPAIIHDKDDKNDYLSQEQFQIFAQYVNSLILRRMGYMPDSRLGTYFQNLNNILDKMDNFKVINCGITINI